MTRIQICKFELTHAQNSSYIKWLNDKEVTQYLGRDDMEGIILKEDAISYYRKIEKNELAYFYALYDIESQNFIGTCKVTLLSRSGIKEGICDLGIMIGDKRYWGKGYGSEAINIMAHICYNKLKVRKITAGCFANNTGMIKAFINNGFKIEGVLKNQLKYKKKYVDHILFGCFIEDLVEKI